MFKFQRPTNGQISFKDIENFSNNDINIYFNFIITMNELVITITICTVLILITIFIVGYIIEYQIKNLKNKLTRQEIVDYINNMDVYVRDEQCNILKHHAHIGSLNLYDFQKIIIDVNKK